MAYTVSVGMTPTAPSFKSLTTGSNFQLSAPDSSASTYSNPSSCNRLTQIISKQIKPQLNDTGSERNLKAEVKGVYLGEVRSRVLETLGTSFDSHSQHANARAVLGWVERHTAAPKPRHLPNRPE